jgi:hypothetical protein
LSGDRSKKYLPFHPSMYVNQIFFSDFRGETIPCCH